MAFIIPDKILETQVCDSCHKYLSVKPIRVYPNRRIKCGRCCRSKKQSDGVISLYGVIAEKCLFKCVNRFDGCRELLTYSQVRDHERECLGKVYKCPICPGSADVATFLMTKHFHDNHKDAILDFPGFVFNPNVSSETSKVYLYQQGDNLFFLYFSSSKLEETIRLNLMYVGDPKLAKNIHQQFTISNGNKALAFTSKSKACSAYAITNCDNISINVSHAADTIFLKFHIIHKYPKLIKLPTGVELNAASSLIGPIIPVELAANCDKPKFTPMVKNGSPRKIFLSLTFFQKFPKYCLSKCGTAITESQVEYYLHCYNCQEICWRGLSQDILVQRFYYSTTFKHSICYYCFQMLKYDKKVEENDYMVSNFPKDMLKHIEFYCKWNCGETFIAQYHLGHEQSCKVQPLQACPEYNCLYNGTIVDVAVHMAIHTNKEVCAYSNFYISSLFDRNIYVFLNNQFIYLKVVSSSSKGFSIKVHMAVNDYDCQETEIWKPLVLLFDDSKNFQMTFQNSITKNEGNHWIKIILIKQSTKVNIL